MQEYNSELSDEITSRETCVAIIGLGYVGLPLAAAFAKAGFQVVGIDISEAKVDVLNAGRSYIPDVEDGDLRPYVEIGRLVATTDYDALCDAEAILICVPTPYDAQRAPDLSFIRDACEAISSRLRQGQLVVLQSTTYPGTTTEIVQPILEKSKLKAGEDFYLAFSPERIDPGNKQWTAYNTPKVVGGITEASTRAAATLLEQMGAQVHTVSSSSTAEMTKLLENTFRAVNIALVNELALLAERMGIDFWEVIEAAKTKPFGFMPFYPGPGVGGHCIPVDPYYLSWKAREYDYYAEFIELAGEVNQAMPYHVVELVSQALSLVRKPVHGARLLVLGVAFKPDIDDARNSPAERIIELLLTRGATVRYHDPYISRLRVGGNVFCPEPRVMASQPLTSDEIRAADVVVIITGHRCLDYEDIVKQAQLVIDTCNATGALDRVARVIRLGAPLPANLLYDD